MIINENCIKCQIRKNMNAYPAGTSSEKIGIYQSGVREILENCDGLSTPQVAEKMYDLRRELFGADKDYSEIKSYYNRLMLSLFPYMEEQVRNADDPLTMAIQYAMVGNYIDFGAMENVDESVLRAQHILPFPVQMRSVHEEVQCTAVYGDNDQGNRLS